MAEANKRGATATAIDYAHAADEVMLRAADFVRDQHNPEKPTLLPLSRRTVERRVAAGTFPQPTKIGRATCWRLGDIRRWMAEQLGTAEGAT
jgi:predicted DNA-binding transcriptional regulator AlpA